VLINIVLKPNAMLTFLCKGVMEDEAMAIAQKFDWKQIRALLD
jgi:hypothetical protein